MVDKEVINYNYLSKLSNQDFIMSEIAKKLIAKNLKKKEKLLDLGKCGLTDLNAVPELFDCEHLEILILSDSSYDFGGDYEKREYYKSASNKASNKISVLPPEMVRLKKLEMLFASSIGLENIDIVGDMPQLEHLQIGGSNPIKDITCLKNLVNLRGLETPYNHSIELDYSVLAFLKQLRYLSIGFNNQYAKYISVLEGLTQLRFLFIGGNLPNLSPLANLSELEELFARCCNTADISTLAKLKKINTLVLDRNYHIENIESLAGLSKLRFLNLESNRVQDISPLTNLLNLNYLTLDFNQVSDIAPLAKLTVLEVLKLNNNRIKSIEALQEMDYLSHLELANNQIQDIAPLKELKQLKTLHINNNQIQNIEAIKGIKSLEVLVMGENPMEESVAIFASNPANYPFLGYLSLPSNSIADVPESIRKLQGRDGRFAKLLHEHFKSIGKSE